MIYIRDEGETIRQGFNFYPRRSGSVGFVLAIGRFRLMLRYSKITGYLHFYGWRNGEGLDI